MRPRFPIFAAGVLGACAAAWLAHGALRGTSRGPAREAAPAQVSTAPATSAPTAAPPLPRSLRGTEPDGGLVTDAEGRFVPTRDALDLFDYFLSASGEEPDAVIRARIEAAIAARLADPAPALDLLDRYLAYRDEVRTLYEEEDGAALPLERRLQRIRELRRAHFGESLAETLFGEEEGRWRVDLARLDVLETPGLSEEERAKRLGAVDAELPEPVREAQTAATAALTLRRDEARLRSEGGSDAEIAALREARFGPEAAARLAALDRTRAAWDARVAAYRAERDRLAALEADDPQARAAAIGALRDERFQGPERIRIEALDRMEEAAASPGRAASSR